MATCEIKPEVRTLKIKKKKITKLTQESVINNRSLFTGQSPG